MLAHVFGFITLAAVPFDCLAAGGDATHVRVILCSDESFPTREALADELRRYLTFARVEVTASCPAREQHEAFYAVFQTTPNGEVRLQIESRDAPTRTRALEWVVNGPAIAETIRRSQIPALALVLEALLLEFESVQLLAAPTLPLPINHPSSVEAPITVERPSVSQDTSPSKASASQSPAARPSRILATDAAPAPHPARSESIRNQSTDAPLGPSRRRVRPKRVGLQVGAGASFLPGDVVAPVLGMAASFEGDSFGAVLALRATLDSNFAIGSRSFETSSYAIALGPRLRLIEHGPFWFGSELHVLGMSSRSRRDDLVDSYNRQWFDLGLGAEVIGKLHLFSGMWFFVRGGVQWIPTAREANIRNGPSRSTGLARLPVLAGVEHYF